MFELFSFVNNTPVVVILMPIVLAFCRDHNIAASKLLIPLSYATILEAPAPWSDNSTNSVVLGQVQKPRYDGIQMFTVTPMGPIYAAAGLLYLWTLGRKWLPSRPTLSTSASGPHSARFPAPGQNFPADSPHISTTPINLMQTELLGTKIVEVRRRGFTRKKSCSTSTWKKETAFFSCATPESDQVRKPKAWTWAGMTAAGWKRLEQRDVQIVEGMIANNSEFAGLSLSELKLRQRFNIFVLAIHRQGKTSRTWGRTPSWRQGTRFFWKDRRKE